MEIKFSVEDLNCLDEISKYFDNEDYNKVMVDALWCYKYSLQGFGKTKEVKK